MKPDIEKTRAYYRDLGPENICGCDYCRNYRARVKAAYPEVARYLASLVDIMVGQFGNFRNFRMYSFVIFWFFPAIEGIHGVEGAVQFYCPDLNDFDG